MIPKAQVVHPQLMPDPETAGYLFRLKAGLHSADEARKVWGGLNPSIPDALAAVPRGVLVMPNHQAVEPTPRCAYCRTIVTQKRCESCGANQ